MKIYHSKTQPQNMWNVSLLNILLKSTNINILGHSLQGKLQVEFGKQWKEKMGGVKRNLYKID